jgi:lipoyl(octanoyl) transferase
MLRARALPRRFSAAPPPARASALLYDLPGLTPYGLALSWQRALFAARTGGAPDAPPPARPHANVVIALQHAPVFTLGRAASAADLIFPGLPPQPPAPAPPPPADADEAPLPPAPAGFSVHRVERGGKVTYHGPGQLVVYPLLDLRAFRADLHWYVESIEEVVIRALRAAGGVRAFRLKGSPGVWVGRAGSERKIAAVGMNCSKWFTQHGFAINVDPDLAHFGHIVPCGIRDRAVTSLAAEAAAAGGGGGGGGGGAAPSVAAVKAHALAAFSEIFNCDLEPRAGAPTDSEGS